MPIVTPFKPQDFSVDYDSLKKYVQFLYSSGIRSVVVGGTTGESVSLTNEERSEIVRVIKNLYPDMIVAGGIITCDWMSLHKMLKAFEQCEALLVMPQMFIRPRDEDVEVFFDNIIAKTNKKIVLYNNPARLGVNISKMYAKLYDREHVIGVKETCFDLSDPQTLPSIPWWCGEDLLAADAVKAGAVGLISALSNLLPDLALRIASKQSNEADETKWKEWSRVIQDYRNPVPIKYLLYKMGIINSSCLRFALQMPDLTSLDELIA